jgi:hypothetical protein
MEHSTAQRRLVKSPPELWAEVSSEDTLGRHLAPFGEIRITRMEPETTVAWEGERASGTVELAPAGWGTKVVLTATPAERAVARPASPAEAVQRAALPAAPPPDRVRDPAPAPARALTPDQPRHAGFLARLRRRRQADAAQPAPAPPEPRPPALGPEPLPPDPDPAPTPAPPATAPAAARSPAPALDTPRTQAILSDVLDGLGAAHHRPFSRD